MAVITPMRERVSPAATGAEAVERAQRTLSDVLDSSAAGERWRAALEEAVLALDSALVAHRETDEGDRGELARVVEEKPALMPRVEEQLQEHADLLRRAARLRGALRAARQFESWDADRLALEGRVLANATRLHSVLDNELFAEALMVVEGGEGG